LNVGFDLPGTGKTHLATAIAVQAIQQHHKRIRFLSTIELVNLLEQEKQMGKQGTERFTFQDLKAKGASDFEGDKRQASGHKSESMVAVYDRKTLEIESTS
jgi:hypothetical protein